MWKAKKYLAEHEISFQPGVNEELGATAVWGSQQVNLFPGATKQGVFAMWYGKGPGLDRSMDVFKHANSAGSSQFGGVLLLAGDDHAAKSSTVAYQSEHNLQSAGIPVLYPSNVQEYLDFGVHGWAMSRYSGLWVAMKCVTDVIESSSSVELDPDRVQTITPPDFDMPEGGLSIRWPDPPLDQEARLNNYKFYAALAYVRANKLDKIIFDSPKARFGIMTAGKAYLDVRQALTDLGLDEATCADIGIRLYKVGCVWPLEAQGARHFAEGLDEILVVEEKRQIMEYALKEELYNWRDDVRPMSTVNSMRVTMVAANGPCPAATGYCRPITNCLLRLSPRPLPNAWKNMPFPTRFAPASRPALRLSMPRNRMPSGRLSCRIASPGSVRAAPTTRLRACPKAPAQWPASAATI